MAMYDNSDRPNFLDIDAKQRRFYERQRRKARLSSAAILFWIFASTFVIVPLIFRHSPLWIVAGATGIIGAIIGWLLPTNVPMPRPPDRDPSQPYGVYDPRGPYGPRS
jgi:hypothetical protein